MRNLGDVAGPEDGDVCTRVDFEPHGKAVDAEGHVPCVVQMRGFDGSEIVLVGVICVMDLADARL